MISIWACLICLFSISNAFSIEFYPNQEIEVYMGDTAYVYYNVTGHDTDVQISVGSEDGQVVRGQVAAGLQENGTHDGAIAVFGSFLGISHLYISAEKQNDVRNHTIFVRVIRKERAIDKAFTGSIIILVSLIYINFGCVLDLNKVGQILRRPVGPCIGLAGQFLAMPLFSYALGLLFFPERADMRLGLLFTGVSPAGGASNVWTCVLDGNIDMSVAMTTVSTFSAFGMMPLWLFTLGPHVFEKAKVAVPYAHIASLAGGLIIPLSIGCALKKWAPRIANPLARALKGFASFLILFIIIFASITNSHLFSLFTWRIAIAGLSLPFLGYIFGWVIARWLTRRNIEDSIAIAIETGIQNTGIAIFLLKFGLPQPQADLTTVVPVSVAIMTPLPLMLIWIGKKLNGRFSGKHKVFEVPSRPQTPLNGDVESSHLAK